MPARAPGPDQSTLRELYAAEPRRARAAAGLTQEQLAEQISYLRAWST